MEQKKFNFDGVPTFLRGFHNWVNWKLQDSKKVPLNPNDEGKASPTDPKTWSTFDQAKKRYTESKNGICGIGFEFTNSPCTGIDLDKCRDPKTGVIDQWAMDIVNAFRSYTEISPSGTGLHIFVLGKLPIGSSRRRKDNIEIYDSDRYFTVTGNLLPGHPEIKDCQDKLTNFYHKVFPEEIQPKDQRSIPPQHVTEQKPSALTAPRSLNEELFGQSGNSPLAMSDDEVIKKASEAKNGEKFKKLFVDGDWSDYLSRSEADLALTGLLKFQTQDDEQIKRILIRSALYRDKWDKNKTYLDRTIGKASSTEHYQPVVKPTTDQKDQPEETPHTKKDLTSDLRIWLDNCHGNFSLIQIYTDLCATTKQERNLIQQELSRAIGRDQVERLRKYGEYRKIEKGRERMQCPSVLPIPLNIKFPCGIEVYLSIYRGNIIVVSGSPNSGKTGYCLNLAKLNMDRFKVKYISSEMRSEELYVRLNKFDDPCAEEMFNKIHFVPCTSEFQDEIEPDSLNIVDYLEIPEGEFYKIQDQIRKIFDKLKDGVAVICLQKNKDSDLPRGGIGSIEKARIAIAIENNVIFIKKGKLWKTELNPERLTRRFSLVGGVNFKWDQWENQGGRYANYN